MKKLMLTYQTLSMGSDDPTQRWIIEASKAAGVNLVPFFEQWRFSVSADTKSRIAALNLGPVPFNIVSWRVRFEAMGFRRRGPGGCGVGVCIPQSPPPRAPNPMDAMLGGVSETCKASVELCSAPLLSLLLAACHVRATRAAARLG